MIYMPFDDFDLQVQCEEVYTEEEYEFLNEQKEKIWFLLKKML